MTDAINLQALSSQITNLITECKQQKELLSSNIKQMREDRQNLISIERSLVQIRLELNKHTKELLKLRKDTLDSIEEAYSQSVQAIQE